MEKEIEAAIVLRDLLIVYWLKQDAEESKLAMTKTHKRFNTRMGFPVAACTPNRMRLKDDFKRWHKDAKTTNAWSHVTCKNCIKLGEK